MGKTNRTFGLHAALKEHIVSGKPLTRLEALVFFGVANLPTAITALRKEGWIIQKRPISFSKALTRVNQYAVLQTPDDLPTKDIQLTEYWASL